MYLVSLCFDNETNKRLQGYIHNVAEKSGNRYMVEHNVPPHITISAFETCNEAGVINTLEHAVKGMKTYSLQWISIGVFRLSTIFIQPVLSEDLHSMSEMIYESILNISGVQVSKYYKPFSWLPHATIAKQLSEVEMRKAFDVLQKSFGAFEGEVVRIEIAKKNPYRIVASWELKD